MTVLNNKLHGAESLRTLTFYRYCQHNYVIIYFNYSRCLHYVFWKFAIFGCSETNSHSVTQEISFLLQNPDVYHHVLKSLTGLYSESDQCSPHTFSSFLKIQFYVNLPSVLCSPKYSLSSGLPVKIFYAFFTSSNMLHILPLSFSFI